MEDAVDIAPEATDAERVQLIEKISALTGIKHVDSATWSCLWFSDMTRLQELLDTIQESRQGLIFAAFENVASARALRSWTARCRKMNDEKDDTPDTAQVPKKRKIEEGPSEEATPSEAAPPFKRSDTVKKLCLQRDRESCIVTNAGEPIEVCHIFPYTMGKLSGEAHSKFWGTLSMFWTEERINEWKQQILGDERTEVCQNLLTLCPNAHRLWGRARFAFQPVKLSEDQKSLTLRFFWLPTRKFTKRMSISTRPSLPPALESGPKHAKLFDCLSEMKVCSGQEITMNTDDPHNKPLPSMELLQMQWTLNRLAAISGAADVDDEELDDTDDDDDEEVPVERPSYRTPRPSRSPSRGRENQPPPRPSRSSSKVREDASFTLPHRPSFRGTTYTGEYEDVKAVNDLLIEKGLNVPIHVDAASGGFVAPFVTPELEWDFRLDKVVSINVSGHKYGLVYPGVGWALWRSADYLPKDLIFKLSYLGTKQASFTLNFSRGSSHVIAQYYQFVCLGKAGYVKAIQNIMQVATNLAHTLREMGFLILSKAGDCGIPVVAFRINPSDGYGVDEFDLAGELGKTSDIKLLRVVCRVDFTPDLCDGFVKDLKLAMNKLKLRDLDVENKCRTCSG